MAVVTRDAPVSAATSFVAGCFPPRNSVNWPLLTTPVFVIDHAGGIAGHQAVLGAFFDRQRKYAKAPCMLPWIT
ncbi:MAG: hypothetical protein IPG64_11155 [Haliea sp.]|nr:hypothetical protein [Haliea sp.]